MPIAAKCADLLPLIAFGAVLLVAGPGFAQSAPPGGTAPAPQTATIASTSDAPDPSSFGVFDVSGSGFLVGRSKFGELSIGGYALVRYVNQLPANQTFTDHLGNVNTIDPGTTFSSIACR